MERPEFEGYLEGSIRSYAADNVRAGRWSSEEALSESRKQIAGILPDGQATPNHLFYFIVAGEPEVRVGAIWLAIEPRGAYVYDLNVSEPFRRRGYAEAAMRSIEEVARAKGSTKILLHVFGDNLVARRLYVRLGYGETNVMMAKSLVR